MASNNNDAEGRMIESVTSKYAQNNREANSLKIRLETESIKEKISSYLTGRVKDYKQDSQGNISIEEKSIGQAKTNQIGYQAIMSYVESLVNKSTVMGNFPLTEDLYDFLKRSRKVFTMDLWINMHNYGIKSEEFGGIINNLFSLIEPFMTRTVGDGERATIRETTMQQDRVLNNSGGWSFNPGKLFKN